MIYQSRHFRSAIAVQFAILVFMTSVSLCFFEGRLTAQDNPVAGDLQAKVRRWLQKKLNDREVIIWYLSHSGYAVKTKSALLVFDYWEKGRDRENEENPQPFSLANGRINPDEIKDLNVYVFVTHGHLDHYDQVIFEWEKKIGNISYIFGWHAKETPAFHYLAGPRAELNLGGMRISTINETHDGRSGVCFLVNVDGLCLYFSGDYGWAMLDSYKNDFEYLSTKTKPVDIAFLGPGYYRKDSDLVKLEIPASFIQRFSPKIVFPQHYGGREGLMAELVARTKEDFPLVRFESPRARGERWHFKMK